MSELNLPSEASPALSENSFTEPWQARVFALMVDMNARGHFAWREFQECLASRIAEDERQHLRRGYYANWLAAAEDLLALKGLR